MATEPVELVREWIDAADGGDSEALAAFADPGIEWVVAKEHPAATTHRGLEAVGAYLDDWRATMPDMRFEVDSISESGGRVLVVGRVRGSGAGSGAGVEIPIATLWTLRGSRVIRVEEFLDPDQARSLLG